MNLHKIRVPRAGPFRTGRWCGTEMVITQRPWFSAILCWVLAAFCAGLLVAGAKFPKSVWALEPEQARFVGWTAAAFAVIGAIVALWKRTWVVDPGGKRVWFGTGFGSRPGRSVEAANGVWLAVHPIDVHVRGGMSWPGFAVVIHAGEKEGVVCAMTDTAAQAEVEARRLAEMMRVNVGGTGAERLKARV